MRHHAFVAAMGFLIAAVLVPGQAQAASADPTGYWRKAEQGERPGKFHIFRCGRGNQLLCAKIIWLQDPLDSQGRPLHDVRNENPAMRDRPIMGLPIINGMQQVAGNQWKGSIYNPEDGNTYSATLTVVSRNQINVKGCKAWLLCGERTWLRTSPPPKPEPEPEIEASAEPDSGTEVASEAEEEKPNALSDAEMLEPAVEHPTRPGYRFLNTGTDHETPAGFGGENVDSMFVMTKPIASETDEATESAEADPAASAEDAPQSASEAAPPAPTPAPAAEPKPEAQPQPAPQSMQANAAPTPRTTPAPQAAPVDPESDAAAETQTAETDLAEEPPLTWRERRLLRRQQKRGLLPWLR